MSFSVVLVRRVRSRMQIGPSMQDYLSRRRRPPGPPPGPPPPLSDSEDDTNLTDEDEGWLTFLTIELSVLQCVNVVGVEKCHPGSKSLTLRKLPISVCC